ncbi:MAG: MotA/TolQ/ExbB proton channel family protein [Thermoguttaceae bacterium]|nr:MotA/TolQ/ExbB proton channel family protein [Thermoguttaceae bacterium]
MIKYWWPPDITGQIICCVISVLLAYSFLALCYCCWYRRARAKEMLLFLQNSFAKDILGVVPKGKGPDSGSSDISQLEWWIREIPSYPVKDVSLLNTIFSKGDSYKLRRRYVNYLNFLTEICSIYPMLGILGTVMGVSFSIIQPDKLMDSFSTAVITTIWGIIAGISHTIILSFFYAYLHELDEIPSKIESSLYDLKQNIYHGRKQCDEQD